MAAATTGSAYIGCKISLISKSDIRYEGILYQLNQDEATVALANVRSFGTEERRPDAPIAGRDLVYDYILFRGPDIKDIVVCEPPRLDLFPQQRRNDLQDPAILEATPLNAASTGLGALTGSGNSAQAAAGASALHSQTSSSAVGAHLPRSLYSDSANARNQNQRGGRSGNRQDDGDEDYYGNGGQRRRQDSQRYQEEDTHATGGYRDYGSSRGGGYGYSDRDGGYGGRGYLSNGNRGRGMAGQGYGQGRGGGGDYASRGGYQGRGGYQNNRSYSGDDSGQPRRRNDYQQSTGISSTGGQNNSSAPKETKDNLPEYDFENAEKVFHELETQTKKLSVNDKAGDAAVDGIKEEESAQNSTKFYDPNSFFDQISCEALEKEKNPGQRPDWRRERQVNTETFGVSGTGFRGRGRGGFQGRGGYRGGNRGGNQGGNYRSGNQGGGYNNYDDGGYGRNEQDGGYRPRGGNRYSNDGGYAVSRSFVPSYQRQSQNAGRGANGNYGDRETYFRCPSSPQTMRRQRAQSPRQLTQLQPPRRRLISPQPAIHRHIIRTVRYEDEEDWEDADYDERSMRRGNNNMQGGQNQAGGAGSGRRRRNRGGRAGNNNDNGGGSGSAGGAGGGSGSAGGAGGSSGGGQRNASRTSSKQSNQPARNNGGNNQQSQNQGQPTNGGGRRGGRRSRDQVDGNTQGGDKGAAGGNGQRRRGRRNAGEWVQYELPNDCKNLLPQDNTSGGNTGAGQGADKSGVSLMGFLDSPANASSPSMAPTKAADWNMVTEPSRMTAVGDMGLTGDNGSRPQIPEVESH